MPLFSVVIPLYNKENYISETINSVLKQSVQDFELIVINDGSTDKSLDIVKSFNDFRISLIDQKNIGLSATRNKGIKLAKGRIVALLDADDLWQPNFLKEIKSFHEAHPDIDVFGTSYQEYNGKQFLNTKKNIPKIKFGTSFIINNFFECNLFQPIITASSIAFKKGVMKDLTFDSAIDYGEDIDFYIKCFSQYKLGYIYKNLAIIRVDNQDQITTTGIKDKKIPDFDTYKDITPNSSLKKYLDFVRYSFATQYKTIGDFSNYKKLADAIDKSNLTSKQAFLLKSPRVLLVLLRNMKKQLLKRNIRLTSF